MFYSIQRIIRRLNRKVKYISMYKAKTKCICCNRNNLELLLDLNGQPLANSYHNNLRVNLLKV